LRDLKNRKRKKQKTLTLPTNPPINLINNPPSHPHPNMVVNNLRNPIPTHRPNRPRQPHNVTRTRSGRGNPSHHFARPPLLGNIPVRSLPRAVFAEDEAFARARARRGFEEAGVCWRRAWWALGEGRRRRVAWESAAATVVGAGKGARWSSGGEW